MLQREHWETRRVDRGKSGARQSVELSGKEVSILLSTGWDLGQQYPVSLVGTTRSTQELVTFASKNLEEYEASAPAKNQKWSSRLWLGRVHPSHTGREEGLWGGGGEGRNGIPTGIAEGKAWGGIGADRIQWENYADVATKVAQIQRCSGKNIWRFNGHSH